MRANLDLGREVNGVPAGSDVLSDYTGLGVTVAILDSGITDHRDLRNRILMSVNLVSVVDEVVTGDGPAGNTMAPIHFDAFGHGTHVAGIVAGDGQRSGRTYRGVAPDANLISVRVLDDQGAGTTSRVIAGLEWVLQHRKDFNIRVVNLSLGHPVFESVEKDPLVRAVETLWSDSVLWSDTVPEAD